ncbi:6-phosphogluconolactonase [Gillisia mitskevichiae]|uniref:6-phosphogluconolactonase n=1 Tax=Gillisia mitskevichiae TaxID=270921 RepID=A0A495PUN9_9FLAO|nr:lactonase family protein [Gillisia mitskevichiae]RKS53178.1 6-phosphogluconolactonase [Gillisia mitskevichiae]
MNRFFLSSLCVLLFFTSCKNEIKDKQKAEVSGSSNSKLNPIYIGTYTKKEGHVDGQADGIYSVYQNPETGAIEMGKILANVVNPSFVKTSGDNKNLYAISELGPSDGTAGLIYSFRIKEDESLEQVGSISTESFAPCFIAEDRTGKFIFVANYLGGVVMMYEKKADGSLESLQKISLVNPEKSHPHSVNISSNNKYAYITDLGNDRIWIFNLDLDSKSLIPNSTPYIQLEEGSGPRHFAFSKSNDYAYSINELNGSISAFKIEQDGKLNHLNDISSLPEDFTDKNSAADIHIHPSGKYLYVSNRGHNSIAAYRINQNTGSLKNIGFTNTQGETPRNFAISPDGNFLYVANQNTNNLVSFKVDLETGKLLETGNSLAIKTPVCIEFLN